MPRDRGSRVCLRMGLERKAVLRAAPAHTAHYERRRPQETTLHHLVREHLETFLAQVGARTGTGLPAFVREEFEAFLECGILAHGFLRVRCVDCAHEKLVAFSCKRRGFCPSCGARRMAESAAVLVDEIIPRVPVRQGVLSFPIPLRILIAAHPELLTPLLRIIHRVIAGFQLKQTGLKRAEAVAPRALKVRFPTLSTSAAGRKYEWRFSVSGRSEAPARFFSTDQVQCRQCDEQLTYEAPNFNDCNGRTSGYRQAHPRAHGGRVDVTVGHPGARAAGAGYRIGVG